ncbi:STAS domain-containing protein [Actinoplanes sp. NPDC026623]|uniref:STAS domain-containing protein n=1 Tax=Actinoplanes sp. NPDC026623 TaxID=3155610 RepID=UPI0033C747E5
MSEETVTSLERGDDVVTVVLRGEVDVLNVGQVRVALEEALESRPRTIVVDLSGLSFIDSSGLGSLTFGFQRARDSGIAFRLARPGPAVRRILVLSGLLEVVELSE